MGLRGSSWGLKGRGWGKKFSPSCGAGRGWGKKNPCGAGAKISSFGPAPPHCHPYPTAAIPIMNNHKDQLKGNKCSIVTMKILINDGKKSILHFSKVPNGD